MKFIELKLHLGNPASTPATSCYVNLLTVTTVVPRYTQKAEPKRGERKPAPVLRFDIDLADGSRFTVNDPDSVVKLAEIVGMPL